MVTETVETSTAGAAGAYMVRYSIGREGMVWCGGSVDDPEVDANELSFITCGLEAASRPASSSVAVGEEVTLAIDMLDMP